MNRRQVSGSEDRATLVEGTEFDVLFAKTQTRTADALTSRA